MSILNKISIGASPLTGSIYLFRHGKDKNVALEHRDAEAELFATLIQHMQHEMKDGPIAKVVCFGDKCFDIRITPCDREGKPV